VNTAAAETTNILIKMENNTELPNNGYNGVERRKARRIRVSLQAIYRIDKPISLRMVTADKEVEAVMLDLSEMGMAVVTKYDIPVSTILLLRFTLFNYGKYGGGFYGPMSITAEVRSRLKVENDLYRIGVYFTQVSEKDRQAISDFVKTAGQAIESKRQQPSP